MSEARAPLAAGAALIRLSTRSASAFSRCVRPRACPALQLQVLRLAAEGADMSAARARARGAEVDRDERGRTSSRAAGLALRAGDDEDRRRQIVRSTAAGAARLGEFDAALAAESTACSRPSARPGPVGCAN
ncbi:MAG: hypothetical protein WDM88_11625 [Galbitalea sp.]